jgi:hypothetical protein
MTPDLRVLTGAPYGDVAFVLWGYQVIAYAHVVRHGEC